jgi:hypothetical protein
VPADLFRLPTDDLFSRLSVRCGDEPESSSIGGGMCGPGPLVNAPGISPSGIGWTGPSVSAACDEVESRFVSSFAVLLPFRIGGLTIDSGYVAWAVRLVIVSDRGGVVCDPFGSLVWFLVVTGLPDALPGTSRLVLFVPPTTLVPSGRGLAITGKRPGLLPSVDLSRLCLFVGAGDLARCLSLLIALARASMAALLDDSSVEETARCLAD